jgi:hypothetical protein
VSKILALSLLGLAALTASAVPTVPASAPSPTLTYQVL